MRIIHISHDHPRVFCHNMCKNSGVGAANEISGLGFLIIFIHLSIYYHIHLHLRVCIRSYSEHFSEHERRCSFDLATKI